MLRLPLFLVALGLGAQSGAAEAAFGGWKLPPLEGSLEGDFSGALLPGMPALHWSVTPQVPRPRERTIGFAADGSGARLRGEATLDPHGDGAWRLTESPFDLAVWWPVLAAKYFPAQAAWAVAGTAQFTGEGTIRGGEFAGRLEIELRDGAVADAAKTWSVAGVTLRGRLGHLPAIAFEEPLRAQFREALVAGVALRDGVVEFSVAPDGVVRVASAEWGVMGGRIVLAPFAVGGASREVRTTLEFLAVDLGGLGKFLPSALSDARGLVSGRMEVGWDLDRGLTHISGALRPGVEKSASIKLTPSPGFLTERLPVNMRERINLLPEWAGPIRKLFAPANPAYAILRSIEMGEGALDVAAFEFALNTEGDARGRTAHVVAMTRPTTRGTAVDVVRFEFNVTGPLADLVRLLAEGRVNLHLR